jgi:signal transduction histidine kinase
MPSWLQRLLDDSQYFMPHGHCYLWLPTVLWLHVVSDVLIGVAYVGIALVLWGLVRRMRLPFSPVIVAFGLFIALCGGTHFMGVWTVWQPDYLADGLLKAATALASVATAIGLVRIKPQIEEVVHSARLSGERRIELEHAHAELKVLYEKVKELDELKSRFFANVSHELRTPLALVLGPAQQLLDDPTLGSEHKRLLRTLRDNGRVLLKQVNDLLDLARLDAHRLTLRYAEVDASLCVRRMVAQFEVAAEQRNVQLRLALPGALPAQLDPDPFERILINLLSNAFKFTPAGGRITVALAAPGDGTLVLTVADTGPGVPPAQRQLIFERFRQADGSDTRRHEGTGLGLSIVKEFVELHQGRVSVDDAPGGGARFTVVLPREAPAGTLMHEAPDDGTSQAAATLPGALHALRTSSPPLGGELPTTAAVPGRPQVLVVEDNPEMRAFIGEVLERTFEVFTAPDGETALAEAEALRPDLVVTDLMMPRMGGEGLLRALRQRPALDHVPVLLLSAKTDEALRVRLLGSGAQDYLTKPFQPAELLARVQNWVQVKRAGDLLRGEIASASSDLATLAGEVAAKNRQLQLAVDAAEEARAQAEQANQVKSHFLGLLSHEVRTPLSTLGMNLHLLPKLQPHWDAPARAALDRLRGATTQLRTLIEGLLEYTRLEDGGVRPQAEPVDLVALAREVVQATQDGEPGAVPLRFEPPPEPMAPLQADRRLLTVVLANLVGNAVKFTPRGAITVRVLRREGRPTIEVEDTGIGIPAGALERIFLPFEQLEPLQRKSTPGVGLGLALVRQIVEALHGRVEVTSQPGVGSTFRVVLPSAAQPMETLHGANR